MESTFRGSDWYGAVVTKLTNLAPHPDPETTSLDITRVFAQGDDPNSGIPVVVKRGEFAVGDLVIYHGIDALVPTSTARFAFLDPKGRGRNHQLKARRLRGFYSEGLITPLRPIGDDGVEGLWMGGGRSEPVQLAEGQDLTVLLGITKYVTPADAEPASYKLTVPPTLETTIMACVHNLVRRPEAGPAWVWISKELIESAVKRGFCKVNEIEVRDSTVWVKAGDVVEIVIFPGEAPRGSRATGYLPTSYAESCPRNHLVPHYDLDPLHQWSSTLVEGEEVVAREKLHGCNARTFHDGERLWVGSRAQWKRRPTKPCSDCCPPDVKGEEGSLEALVEAPTCTSCSGDGKVFDPAGDTWWKAALKYKLDEKLKLVPGLVLFYEVYGWIQDLRYGHQQGDASIAVFDALIPPDTRVPNGYPLFGGDRWGETGSIFRSGWLDDDELRGLCTALELPMAPELYRGPWNDKVRELRNGPSTIAGANHTREGIVIRPARERIHPRLGRVVLKLVGEDFRLR